MIINTFSYIWKQTAVDAMCDLASGGYRVFEVPVSSPHCWPDEMSRQSRMDGKKRLDDCGATVRSLNAGGYDINLASPAANMRRKSIKHIKDVIGLAVDWGVADVVISPGTRRPMISPSLPQTLGWMYESLGILMPTAEQAGVRLLLENTPYCFRPTIGEMMEIVDEVGSPRLQIVYDVANAAFIREDPVAALLSHHAATALIHVSDTGLEIWGHDPIGTGVVDFEALGAAIVRTDKMQDVVLEVIREATARQEIDNGVRDLAGKGWDFVRQSQPAP
ncbi:MAG: sugar phosphate isomerase/epimerase family protein [Trebonia sp.]